MEMGNPNSKKTNADPQQTPQAVENKTGVNDTQTPVEAIKNNQPAEQSEESMGEADPFLVTDVNNTVAQGQLFVLNKDLTAVLANSNVTLKYTGSWHRNTPGSVIGYIELTVTQNGEPKDVRQVVDDFKPVTFQLADQYRATVYKQEYDQSITMKIY